MLIRWPLIQKATWSIEKKKERKQEREERGEGGKEKKKEKERMKRNERARRIASCNDQVAGILEGRNEPSLSADV